MGEESRIGMGSAPSTVNMVANGKTIAVPEDQVEEALANGFALEDDTAKYDRLTKERLEEEHGGVVGKVTAVGFGALRGATLGLSDLGYAGLGEGDTLREIREVNPGLSTIGEVGGALLTAIPSGGTSLLARAPAAAAARLGARIAQTGEGAGALARVGRGALGFGVEGGITGLGQGVSELALSDDPLTLERAVSTLSSNALYGGALGAGVGAGAKGVELALGKARGAIDRFVSARAARENIADDLAQMDAKQLRAARDTELDTIKATQKTELEAIEAERVGARKAIADDIAAHRAAAKQEKVWLATKDSTDVEIRTIGRLSKKADDQVRNLLDDPKYLAEKPESALRALRRQEHALDEMLRVEDKLRAGFAADKSGTRAAALDAVPTALERNRALQTRIREIAAAPKPKSPDVSPRLQSIEDARELLATSGGKEKTVAEQMLQGAVFSSVAGGVGAATEGTPLGFLGGIAAPFLGAKAAKLVTGKVFGGLGKAVDSAAVRTANAAKTFLDVSGKAVKVAPVLATRTLASLRYAPARDEEKSAKPTKKGKAKQKKAAPQLAVEYKARAAELRSQTAYGPDGRTVMRPEARSRMADQLAAIRAYAPLLADRMETLAVRRYVFLAGKLARKPDLGAIPTGPDRWQPSDMEMRAFARYAAATEDPIGILERLAAGTVTPEDGEVLREVYPEMHAEITRQIVEQLPTLQRTLPYHRRLALSIVSGVAVDPALDPRVLSVLQGQFATEEGSAGGTQPPLAQAQFGSVSKSVPEPTPAQRRAG